jgi:hypothetical protein
LLEQAKRLTAEERAELIEGLQLLGGHAPLPAAELWAAWRPELDRRRSLLDSGELETVDAREHIEAARVRLRASVK